MLKIITIILVMILCVFTALYTININSIDNAVISITNGVFEMSIEIKDEYNDIDMVHINPSRFQGYFEEELKNNLAFYQGDVTVEYYFYNVLTMSVCNETISCNGVQIRLTMKSFYMFNHQRRYRYEVKTSGN